MERKTTRTSTSTLTQKSIHKLLTYLIAAIWFVNGLFCKVLNLVPRHQEIVSRILRSEYSRILTVNARLFIQFFGYSSKLWKGKIFETLIHIIFSLFWIYLSIVFFKIWNS
jgi:hypothetical protein